MISTSRRFLVFTLLFALGGTLSSASPAASNLVSWGTSAPGPIPDGTFVSIAAGKGSQHCLGVLTDGTLAVWGTSYGPAPSGTYTGTYALVCAGYFVPGAGVNSTIAALDGKLYFGCEDQRIYCVDAGALTQAWRTDTLGSAVTSSTAISAPTGVLFTTSSNGRILAFDAETGDDLWEYDLRYLQGENWTTAQIKSRPAIGNDRLFVVAGDDSGRKLYCFGP